MPHPRFTALVIGCLGCVTLLPGPVRAQAPDDKKRQGAIQRTQMLLDERLVDSALFDNDMPLGKFLEALEQQLPKYKKVAFVIVKEAFDERQIAATPIRLPPSPQKFSLRKVLELTLEQLKAKADYRLGNAEVVITSPQRALYAVTYDIGEVMAKPDLWTKDGAACPKDDLAAAASQFLKILLAAVDAQSSPPANDGESMQLLNGTRLELRSNAARHAAAANVIRAFRRLGDVAVFTKARLYEVDEAFHKKLNGLKRVPPEEEEQQFLDGIVGANAALFQQLDKQQVMVSGEEIKADSGQEIALLSRHNVLSRLPSPDQRRSGQKGRQIVLEGTSFLGVIQVSSDRRWVRVKLTERISAIEEIRKVKAWDDRNREVDAEIVFPKDATHSRVLEIPDGGSILIPVHYRPASAQAKGRWWVLCVTARIYIEEEERQVRLAILRTILPRWLAGAITNDD